MKLLLPRFRKKALSSIIMLLIFSFALMPVAKGEALYAPTGGATAVGKVIAQVTPSVVAIIGKPATDESDNAPGRYDLAHGTGIIVRADGVIMTNAHVVKNMKNLVAVTAAGKPYSARVTHYDEESDLALLRIDATDLPTATFAKSSNIQVGDSVIAIGTPISFALRNSVTMGIVSGMDRSVNARYQLIQTDAAINPGNSGGPLVNLAGEVIGINTLKYTDIGIDSLGFAIPADTAAYVLDQFLTYGKVKRPYLGIEIAESWEALVGLPAKQPPAVSYVLPDSPAAKAGLQEGDLLLALNGTPIDSLVGLNELLKRYLPGQTITLSVKTNASTKELTLVLGEEEAQGTWETDGEGAYLDSDEGKTQIGDSHNGWSMKYPAGLVTYNDFSGEDSIIFGDAKEEFLITVHVEKQQSADLSSSRLLRKLVSSGQFGTVLERKYVEEAIYPYAKVVGKLQDGSYYQARAFLRGETVYSVALYIENSDISANKAKLGNYLELLGSFKPVFDALDPALKDIAKAQTVRTVTSDYGFTFDIPVAWSESAQAGGLEYANEDYSRSISVTVTSAASGDTLAAWAKRQENLFTSSFASGFRQVGGLKNLKLGDTPALTNTLSYTMGDKWWIDQDVYYIKDKYKYHFILSYSKDTDAAAAKAQIDAIKASIRPDKDLLNGAIGFIQDEDDDTDANRTYTYTNRKYKYELRIPETWQNENTGNTGDIKVAEFSFLGGSLTLEAKPGVKLADILSAEEGEHKKAKAADAGYKYSFAEKILFGGKGRIYQVTAKNKGIPYQMTEYVFAKNGIVYRVELYINDAVRTPENLQRLTKTFDSLKLLD